MKLWKWILPLSVGIVVLVILFVWVIPGEEQGFDIQDTQRMKELEHHNEMLIEVNGILDEKIFLLEIQTDSLRELIVNDQRVITALKTRKDEKIRVMDRYTDDELYRYFARFSALGSKSCELPV
jgi:ABC-type transporter Mla subunit MlaD